MLSWVLLSINYSVSNAQGTSSQLDPTQVYTTGNIVQQTPQGGPTPWVNGVYQDSLTCWAWGDPGYCGPNPIVRPGNNINFSYGLTNLYQMQSIASALPNSGSGLRVNGYNFGFLAKNGNGWDDGRLDTLNAYVNFYNPQGSNVFSRNYNLNYQFNWTSFNFSETFNTPFASKDLSSVQYGFVGRDNNFWAGPYGPEIYNVSFSLKYSVDTCAINVLSSPTCPGYLDQLAKLNPTSSTPTLETAMLPPLPPPPPPGVNEQSAMLPPPPPGPGPGPAQGPGAGPSPGPQGPGPGAGPSPTQSASASPSPSTSSNPAQSERAVSGPSLSTILGIIRNEQSRVSNVESAAVTQANEAATQASSQAQKQAETVAATAVQNSQSSSTAQNTVTGPGINISSSSIQGLLPSTASSSSVVSIGGLRAPTFNSGTDIVSSTSLTTFSGLSSLSNIEIRRNIINQNIEQEAPRQSAIDFTGRTPLRDYLDSRPQVSQDTGKIEQRITEVKKNVQDNEAAGGVTLTAMAKQPPGFELYMQGIRDANFYPPKEIYKNQKVVDNQRVLRQLNSRSDRIHEEMVNEQYRSRD